jgi:hypothetical protein
VPGVNGFCRHCVLAVCASVLPACGGGLPLMHPAQPLPPGVTSVSAGTGSHWIGGQARREIDAAQSQWAASQGDPQSLTPSAALAAALWTPGLFPWVSMRVGLGSRNEAGVAYTGHHARLDARHAFALGGWALSLGLGATMGLMHVRAVNGDGTSTLGSSESLAGLDTSNVRSMGVDLPLIVGWRSAADVARLWMGLRPSYDRGFGNLILSNHSSATTLEFRSDTITVTALAGFALGLRPLFIAMELGFGDARAHGTLLNSPSLASTNSASVSAYSFTPAAALIWEVR